MQMPSPQVFQIAHLSDVSVVRQAAKVLAEVLGFDVKGVSEIAIAVTELSSNLVEHAGAGTITLTPLDEAECRGIQVESADSGPGITDIEQAMTDGYSTKGSGSLGAGLGAVNRLMDEFRIQSEVGKGTTIICRRCLHDAAPIVKLSPLEFGAASHTYPGMEVCGDSFVFKQWDHFALAAVIDGVGHGRPAFEAAQAARTYIENHADQSLELIFQNVGYTCRSTRGVVMALARIDWLESKLTFASVGNIEARLMGAVEPTNFMVRRGIIGYNAPRALTTEHRWTERNMLIMHSDGVKSTWRLEDFPELLGKSASVLAQRLLYTLDRGDDDATMIVVRGAAV